MSDIDWTARAKARRLLAEAAADDPIHRVEKILGLSRLNRCKECEQIPAIAGHGKGCAITKINPDNLQAEIDAGHQKLRKKMNQQRIFKTDQPYWNGLPGKPTKTHVRKRYSNNRGPGREIQLCKVCKVQTIFVNGLCRVCQHDRKCTYINAGNNCQTCWPGK